MLETVLVGSTDGPPPEALVAALRAAAPRAEVLAFGDGDALLAALAARDEPGAGSIVVLTVPADRARETALTWIPRLRAGRLALPVVISTEQADVDLAAEVIGAGASDLLARGPRLEDRVRTLLGKLAPLVEALQRGRRLDVALELQSRTPLVGSAPCLRELLERVRQVAPVPRPVLVLGERGTGKELVARALHQASGRRGPFVAVNCGALGEGVLESELFGHERGAFTGAAEGRPGRFELADGGTLFLDELAHASKSFQQDLLRVVEYGTYTRVGGARERSTTARIVAASNVDLAERVAAGAFLADLYDRLAFEVLAVPPLRARGDDVLLLAEAFLRDFGQEYSPARGARLDDEAKGALRAHPFPGNVRELKTVVERAAYRAAGGVIGVADLGLDVETSPPAPDGFHARVAAFQAELLREALAATGGSARAAAERLGLTTDQFRYHRRRLLRDGGAE